MSPLSVNPFPFHQTP